MTLTNLKSNVAIFGIGLVISLCGAAQVATAKSTKSLKNNITAGEPQLKPITKPLRKNLAINTQLTLCEGDQPHPSCFDGQMPVLKSGWVTMFPGYTVDTDSGQTNPSAGADFYYDGGPRETAPLVPVSGARFSTIALTNPTYADCWNADYSRAAMPVSEIIAANSWDGVRSEQGAVCLKTSRGKIAKISYKAMEGLHDEGDGTVRSPIYVFDYKVWGL